MGVDEPSSASLASVRFLNAPGLSHSRHLLAVQLGHLGVEQQRRLVGCFELRLKFFPASVEGLDLGLALVDGDLIVQHQVQEFLDPRAAARVKRHETA